VKNFNTKYLILIFFVLAICSCRSKKTFNGTAELPCPDHDGVNIDEERKSKWRLVLYKDGRSVFGKKKRGKTKLFKNK
tara:strand:+ start:152 stop:385 length:234 start_codon:yes stop_codon:yes gene_type:complete